MSTKNFDSIVYDPKWLGPVKQAKKSISVIGIDTEAYVTGETFMVATSTGGCYTPEQFRNRLFSRDYRNKIFVSYNLKYEMSAFLRYLPQNVREVLRVEGKTVFEGLTYEIIGYKKLTIRKGKYKTTFYDVLQYFNTSLRKASETYLSSKKLDSAVNEYTPEYVKKHYHEIKRYCIQDARLAAKLAELVISTFETFDIKVRSLISTASISWHYFRRNCDYEHVLWLWKNTPLALRFAQNAYHGGKFEVTKRTTGKLYEYDIVSAYPYEIANLLSIQKAHVYYSNTYREDADYGFYDITLSIPSTQPTPIPRKMSGTVIYPVGTFRTFVTLSELVWLNKRAIPYEIHESIQIFAKNRVYPFKDQIERLTELKHSYKIKEDLMRYQAVKIIMNSLYGKFAQLIPVGDVIKAGDSWNPIFASEITARTRIRVTNMQERYKTVIAVHTDSITSTRPIKIDTGSALGDWEASASGEGVMFGCGIYQIGVKSKFRGFHTKTPLLELIPSEGFSWAMTQLRPYSWREVTFREMDPDYINKFVEQNKFISINIDKKRVWIDDWQDYSEVRSRPVESMPHLIYE